MESISKAKVCHASCTRWQIYKSIVIEVVYLEKKKIFKKFHSLLRDCRDEKKVNYLEVIYFKRKYLNFKVIPTNNNVTYWVCIHTICMTVTFALFVWLEQRPTDWKCSVYNLIFKREDRKKYRSIALISQASNVMLKVIQTRFLP